MAEIGSFGVPYSNGHAIGANIVPGKDGRSHAQLLSTTTLVDSKDDLGNFIVANMLGANIAVGSVPVPEYDRTRPQESGPDYTLRYRVLAPFSFNDGDTVVYWHREAVVFLTTSSAAEFALLGARLQLLPLPP